jgi:hypothetical protein
MSDRVRMHLSLIRMTASHNNTSNEDKGGRRDEDATTERHEILE